MTLDSPLIRDDAQEVARAAGDLPNINAFISKSCRLLDEEDFERWIGLCAPKFNYRITAHSPDLSRDMCWLDVHREELRALFKTVDTHVRVPGTFLRVPGSAYIDKASNGRLLVITPVSAFHTTLQGATTVFAVFRYQDEIEIAENAIRLVDREVRLNTRLLDFAPHVVL
jgi:methanesulfonate monooxygenase small subunit